MHHVTRQDLLTHQLSCGKWNSLTLPNFRPNLQLLLCAPSLLKASHPGSGPSWRSGPQRHFSPWPLQLLPALMPFTESLWAGNKITDCQAGSVRKRDFILSPLAANAVSSTTPPSLQQQQTWGFLFVCFFVLFYWKQCPKFQWSTAFLLVYLRLLACFLNCLPEGICG